MRSNCAKSLLAKRCLKTGVSLPPFSEKRARLHFVPPTSPARITECLRQIAVRYRHRNRKLWVEPLPAITFEQEIGFARPPTAGAVLRDFASSGGAPNIQNGIDERPRGLDIVAAIEKRGIAAQAIIHERGVRTPRGVAKTFFVAEIHGHVADAHV